MDVPATSSEFTATEEDVGHRVLSLLSAATEIVWRLGMGSALVGRSHECDWPTSVLQLPTVSSPKLDPSAPAAEIDAAVRAFCDLREPVYALDAKAVAALSPTVIIAQNHCRVCAVTSEDLKGPACDIRAGRETVVLAPKSLDDVFDDILRIAEALNVPERGTELVGDLRIRLTAVQTRVDRVVKSSSSRQAAVPRVAVLEWNDPVMGCGYWIPELVALAGGAPVCCSGPGGKTPTLGSVSELQAEKPDVVVFALCGFDLPRAARELQQCGLLQTNGWHKLMDAGCRAFVMDGNALINRSGPRLVESAEALAEAINAELDGCFGHMGTQYLMKLSDALALDASGSIGPTATTMAVLRTEKLKARDGSIQSTIVQGHNLQHGDPKAGQATVQSKPGGSSSTETPLEQNGKSADGVNEPCKLQPENGDGPAAVVLAQIAALRCGCDAGAEAAFAFNSPANKARLGSAQRFLQILSGSSAFSSLVGPGASHSRLSGPAHILSHEEAAAADASKSLCLSPGPQSSCSGAVIRRATQAVSVLSAGSDNPAVELQWELVGLSTDDKPGGIVWRTDGVKLVRRHAGNGDE